MDDKKFKLNGFRKPQAPTKHELIMNFEERINRLQNTLSAFANIMGQQLGMLREDLDNVKRQLEAIDYRSLSTLRILANQGVLSIDEHAKYAELLRIKDFEDNAKKDDDARKLVPVAPDYISKTNDIITVEVSCTDTDTKEAVGDFSMLRGKVDIGRGSMGLLEKELVGLKIGDKKSVDLVIGKEYPRFEGRKLTFNITVHDLKLLPPKEEKKEEVPVAPVESVEAPTSDTDDKNVN